MKEWQLFESLNGIDEDLLVRSVHRRRGWPKGLITAAGWAACFGLIFAAGRMAWQLQEPGPAANTQPPQVMATEQTEVTESGDLQWVEQEDWSLIVHETDQAIAVDIAWANGYFTEELTGETLAAVLPEDIPGEWQGYGAYTKDGSLIEVRLYTGEDVSVTISEAPILRCLVVKGETQEIVHNGTHMSLTTAVMDLGKSREWLEADGTIGSLYYLFSAQLPAGERQELETVIRAFAEDAPDLTQVVAQGVESWLDDTVTMEAAQMDPDFGGYMLTSVPQGFGEVSISRYRSQKWDYLSGLWSRGLEDISWRVTWFTEEDAQRVTTVADVENYDLSRYPIPWCDSVPEEKRAMVSDPIFDLEEVTLAVVQARAYQVEDAGDLDSLRMEFSVRCGDILISVQTEGVEPEWVYEQLMKLK